MKNYATMIGNCCKVVAAKNKKEASIKLGVSMSATYLY